MINLKKPKNILLILAGILLIMQLVPTNKNEGKAFTADDILHAVNVPDEVKDILVTSCYDCHSDFTNHMWYESIQPIGWWIHHHIDEGKSELNFSKFNTYSDKRKSHKLEELGEMVSEGEMPMASYTLIHGNAKLTDVQKKLLIDWANSTRMQFPEEENEKH
jgi:Haem-binding domain